MAYHCASQLNDSLDVSQVESMAELLKWADLFEFVDADTLLMHVKTQNDGVYRFFTRETDKQEAFDMETFESESDEAEGTHQPRLRRRRSSRLSVRRRRGKHGTVRTQPRKAPPPLEPLDDSVNTEAFVPRSGVC